MATKVVLITGAAIRIGACIARTFHSKGFDVAISYRSSLTAAQALIDELNAIRADSASCWPAEMTDQASVSRLGRDVLAHHKRLDVLINNAGIAPPRNELKTDINMANQMKRMEGRYDELEPGNYTVDLSDEQWDRMIKIHLYGTFYGTRAALRHMTPQRSGSIVNISSIMGLRPAAGAPHYSAAKAGIIAFTKSTAQEVAPFGIRVNAVCPGWVDTPLLDAFDETTRMGIRMQTPIGRLARAEELAQVVRFLAGPESSYCIGDVFPVSGGWV